MFGDPETRFRCGPFRDTSGDAFPCMFAWQARRLAKGFINVGKMCSEVEAKFGYRASGNAGSHGGFGTGVRRSPSAMDTRAPSERNTASFGKAEATFKKHTAWMNQRLGYKDPKLFQASAAADGFDSAEGTVLPQSRMNKKAARLVRSNICRKAISSKIQHKTPVQ